MCSASFDQEPDGLTDANRNVVRTQLARIHPADAHPEMGAVAWMLVMGLVMAACAVAVFGPVALATLTGGAQ